MNSVSWFLYGAEVLQNLTISLCIIATVTGIAGIIVWIIYGISRMDGDEFSIKIPARLTVVCATCLFVFSFLPGKTTMYAIAASQLGEVALSSPNAKEMIDDTKQILRDYLKSLKKDAGK